jgi:hypothetical protein
VISADKPSTNAVAPSSSIRADVRPPSWEKTVKDALGRMDQNGVQLDLVKTKPYFRNRNDAIHDMAVELLRKLNDKLKLLTLLTAIPPSPQ